MVDSFRRFKGGWRKEKWRERVVGKAVGDERIFIPGRGAGWQMKPAQTSYQT
jgi:hypothetical protein